MLCLYRMCERKRDNRLLEDSEREGDMTVTVKLFATFREGRFKEEKRNYPEKTTIGHIIEQLELPEDQLGAILLNARHVEKDLILHDGDTLSIFPLVGGG